MIEGRAFVFGDDIDTDALAPGAYMKGPIEALAPHCLEALDPDFAARVRPGDIVVAGHRFGIGSSREQAPQALLVLGVAAVVAASFGGIFFRNALNLGLPALVCAAAREGISEGDRVAVDPAGGRVVNHSLGLAFAAEPLPAFIVAMLADGGLLAHLAKRLAR